MSSHDVPFLILGKGSTPHQGGCIMQVVDWISTGGWTDAPNCVLPRLKDIAICTNDRVSDKERQKLLRLAPRLMRTNDQYIRYSQKNPEASYWEMTEQIREYWAGVVRKACLDGNNLHGGPRSYVWCLEQTLDFYDELVGRPEEQEQEIDYSELCALQKA